MGKGQRSPQNGEVPSDAAVRDDAATRDVAAVSSRQRPEDILAHTLTTTARREGADGSDGWSPRGRRIFLIVMAVTGVLLVIGGLLVTNELAPNTGRTGSVNTGPSNGSAANLLHSEDEQPTQTTAPAAGSTPLAIPIPGASTSRSAGPSDTSSPVPTPTAVPQGPSHVSADTPTPTTTAPKAPTTTVPCGLVGQALQSAQVPLPCGAGTGLPLGGKG